MEANIKLNGVMYVNVEDTFPPALQVFKPEHIEPFKDLDKAGEFTVEFLLIATELVAIQEKTNYPN